MTNRRLLSAVLSIAALSAPVVLARENPAVPAPKGSESFATVSKEFTAAQQAFFAERTAAYDEAKKAGGEKEFRWKKLPPMATFSSRFLAVAENNPEGPDAFDALRATLQASFLTMGAEITLPNRAKAVKILRDHYVTKPQIKELIPTLTFFPKANDFNSLVDDIIAQNPDRKVQFAAYKGKIGQLENVAKILDLVKDQKLVARIEKKEGKAYIEEGIASAKAAQIALVPLKKTLDEKYADLNIDLLAIGKPAPEVKIAAVDGAEARLSALKGKVVVLDIWATWCGPCKAMIPHEREMVERLKNKPFALVSISADAEKKTLTDFLANEKMPWTHWWNGPDGGIVEAWGIGEFPTIFVLDAKGVIRFKNIRGEELEKSVNALLAEAKKTPPKSS